MEAVPSSQVFVSYSETTDVPVHHYTASNEQAQQEQVQAKFSFESSGEFINCKIA